MMPSVGGSVWLLGNCYLAPEFQTPFFRRLESGYSFGETSRSWISHLPLTGTR
jgi:hypothetical protein